jgi:methionyl aminopeptidase
MIYIKSKKEIELLKAGGKILAEVVEKLGKSLKPGMSTFDLDQLAGKLIKELGAISAFKNYGVEWGNPFPGNICVSLNDEIVHGIGKKDRLIKNGDLVKIDAGVIYKNYFTDMARTFMVGEVSEEAKKLVLVTEKSFWEGIKNLKEGKMLSEYSKAVQNYVEKNGFSVVRNLVGHGVGKDLHEDPQIPNYYNKKYEDVKLEAGMVLALEPMVNVGKFETKIKKDGWTFITKDRSLSAHYENTIVITKNGVEVLTSIK